MHSVSVVPNVFILGAPKCGTTSLASWLSAHPNVFLTADKEPHFFSTDLANRKVTRQSAYESLFLRASAEHVRVGEASTWYLYSRDAVPNIESSYPGALYVVMVREPWEMANSLYWHNLRHLHEDASDFRQAWEMQPQRASGQNIPPSCREPSFLQYQAVCSLGAQVSRLLETVEAQRVLIVRMSSVRADPGRVYRDVIGFLGLRDDGRSDFPVENPARVARRQWLQRIIVRLARIRRALGISRGFNTLRLNEAPMERKTLDASFENELRKAFADDWTLLQALEDKVRFV